MQDSNEQMSTMETLSGNSKREFHKISMKDIHFPSLVRGLNIGALTKLIDLAIKEKRRKISLESDKKNDSVSYNSSPNNSKDWEEQM